eukprot:m.345805 g.345805  ORF g.345805 m.345805 type:complete len:306 (-) comp27899_c0_seq7:1848-2765(-)
MAVLAGSGVSAFPFDLTGLVATVGAVGACGGCLSVLWCTSASAIQPQEAHGTTARQYPYLTAITFGVTWPVSLGFALSRNCTLKVANELSQIPTLSVSKLMAVCPPDGGDCRRIIVHGTIVGVLNPRQPDRILSGETVIMRDTEQYETRFCLPKYHRSNRELREQRRDTNEDDRQNHVGGDRRRDTDDDVQKRARRLERSSTRFCRTNKVAERAAAIELSDAPGDSMFWPPKVRVDTASLEWKHISPDLYVGGALHARALVLAMAALDWSNGVFEAHNTRHHLQWGEREGGACGAARNAVCRRAH